MAIKLNAAVVAVVVGVTAATGASGFGMTAGQGAWHEKITREGLSAVVQSATLDDLAGKSGTAGAVGAPDLLAFATAEAHCDAGDYFAAPGYPQSEAAARARLEGCRRYVFDKLEEAVRRAGPLVDANGRVVSREYPSFIRCTFVPAAPGRAKCNALESFGAAIHTLQDFYSHSNAVDRPAPGAVSVDNPPGLGGDGPADFMSRPDAPYPTGLISGCFEALSIPNEALGCNYGNGERRVKHAVLNKDAPEKPRAQTGDNFARARSAAAADTRAKWAWFERRLVEVYGERRGRVLACAMRTDDAGRCSA